MKYNGSVARLQLRAGERGPGAAVARRGRLRRPAHPRAGHAVAVAARAVARRPGRSSRPSTPRTCARARCRRRSRCCGPSLEKISARIAVSEDARRTLVEHLGGDAVVIPNGVYVDRFARRPTDPLWVGHAGRGRPWRSSAALDEPRKGLPVLARGACRRCCAGAPGAARAGARPRGRRRRSRRARAARPRRVELLGALDDEAKAPAAALGRRLRRAAHRRGELRHRPRRGDERRGAGGGERPRRVPPGARATATSACCSAAGDAAGAGGGACSALLADEPGRARGLADRASAAVRRYDWSRVAEQVLVGLRDRADRRRPGRRGPGLARAAGPVAGGPP